MTFLCFAFFLYQISESADLTVFLLLKFFWLFFFLRFIEVLTLVWIPDCRPE